MVSKSQVLMIDRLAALVYPRDRHPKIFAMLEAESYLDESGIHEGAAVCVIAGYFGLQNHLRRLERGWKQVLTDARFPMEGFHAKTLIKSIKHAPMLKALGKAIAKQTSVYPVCYGIVVDDFNSFSLPQRRFMTGATIHHATRKLITSGCPGKPYFVPFQNIVKLITEYAAEHAPLGAQVHFNFGIDRPFAEYATSLFKQIKEQAEAPQPPWSTWRSKDRLGIAQFPEASKTAQLQAADLLVHLTYLHMRMWMDAVKAGTISTIEPPELLRLCLFNTLEPKYHQYQDRESLEKVLQKSREHLGDWDNDGETRRPNSHPAA